MRRTRVHTSTSRWLVWACALALSAAITTGCEESTVTVPGDNQGTNQDNQDPNQDPNQTPDNQNNQNNHHHHNHGHPYDDEYEESHGPDDDEVLTDAGQWQGSWRAARAEDDMPLAYFDVFHDEGESSATGNFMMGLAMGDLLSGTTGDLSDVEIGSTTTIAWNPTTDDQEMYWVTLTAESDDLFTGTFEAERNPTTFEVTVERRVFDVDDDAEPFEH